MGLLRRKRRPATAEVRISLDRRDIRSLFRGLSVRKGDVVIGLQDVGWTVIAAELHRAAEESGLFIEVDER